MIRIVTDSSCDLPPALVDQYGLEVVPLTIRFGSDEYVDGRDLGPGDFWRKLRSSDQLPETAAPSAGSFLQAFQNLFEGGATGVVALTLSGQLSGTYQSAVIAAEQLGYPIKVLDSRTVSMGLGLPVLAAARAASAGGDLAAVVAAAVDAADGTHVLAALQTLEFLKRGGRIGGAQALVGSLLDIKPLIAVEDGVVNAAGRVRTRSKAKHALNAHVRDRADRIVEVAVLHGDAADVEPFVESIAGVLPGRTPIVSQLGPVVGTHSGPGTLGVAYRLA
ncbi:MAG TPA: DegV family protein [Acidimicrobiia bacterium]